MTNDPRGFPMQSFNVRVRYVVDLELIERVRAHTEQEALDSVDEDELKMRYLLSHLDMNESINSVFVAEATIVEKAED